MGACQLVRRQCVPVKQLRMLNGEVGVRLPEPPTFLLVGVRRLEHVSQRFGTLIGRLAHQESDFTEHQPHEPVDWPYFLPSLR